MSSIEEDEPRPKRRCGVVHEENYKRNIVRSSRVKGEAYTNYKNKLISKKIKPQGISCKCNFKCSLIINCQVIDKIWNNFYSLENKNIQDTYLQTLIEVKEIQHRRKKNLGNEVGHENFNDEPKNVLHYKKNHSYLYNLNVNGILKTVCKNVFMAVHGISRDRLERICHLLLQNITPTDRRGKNRSGNAKSGEICILIHDHISKFEVKETHHSGKLKKYLDVRLTIRKMYDMFITDNQNLQDRVNYNFFYNYYKENFRYSFGRPQVDVCSTCKNLNSKLKDKRLNDNAKRIVVAELLVHKRRAKKFYTNMKSAASNKDDDTCVLYFNYMQNLLLPIIPIQEIFYMRQLWVNVFSILDMKTKKSKIYIYHEGEANKSPDEICSFLQNYIDKEISNTVKHLILFSDSSSGRNKNHTVVRFLLNLCDRKKFSTIIHNFPVRGHSYSACNRDFGTIKRSLRQVDRIYTPEEYVELILKASSKNCFLVYQVKTEDILSFKKWWPKSYKKITNSDETSGRDVQKSERKSFKVSTYKQFLYNKETRGKVVAKLYIDDLIKSTFSLLKGGKVPPELPTEMAYSIGQVPINNKTIADLQNLKPYLVGYEQFYDQIFKWTTTDGKTRDDPVG